VAMTINQVNLLKELLGDIRFNILGSINNVLHLIIKYINGKKS
jgi:hypothetical protein